MCETRGWVVMCKTRGRLGWVSQWQICVRIDIYTRHIQRDRERNARGTLLRFLLFFSCALHVCICLMWLVGGMNECVLSPPHLGTFVCVCVCVSVQVDDLRGSPMSVGSLEEIIDENHAIVSSAVGPEYYVNMLSFVDKGVLEPGSSVLLHNKVLSVVGTLTDEADPMVSVMKVEKAPTESYADVGGLESQVQEIKEAVELPLTHPELYEDMGIKPPKGVILYGEPGTGKTLLAKAVANSTSATFLRVVGSELIQKYLGDGPKLVRELFRVADELSPTIVFIDEIDAVGTKRYDSQSGGEREIQRTMLELLNQMDGFDARSEVKVIMATNKIESLDPALLRPGRIDRKIEFPLPDVKTKRHIFGIHTGKMNLNDDVNVEEFVMAKDDLSGADIKAVCTEAGLLALRERRMQVTHADFKKAKEKVLYKKKEGVPDGLYL